MRTVQANGTASDFTGGRTDQQRRGETAATEAGQQQETQERERGRGSRQQAAATVKILYSNVQSVFNKLNELAAYAAEENPDFILLTET